MSPLIRAARTEDIPAITAIYAHHVLNGAASFEEVPPDAAEMSRRRQAVLARGLPYLVAEEEGAVQGYAYAGPYRLRTAYRFTVEDSICVAPGRAGRGIGRALLTRVIEACTEAGMRQMIAVIGDSGNVGSLRLHDSLGFEPVGVLKASGFKFGRWVDSVLMQRALGEGAKTPPVE